MQQIIDYKMKLGMVTKFIALILPQKLMPDMLTKLQMDFTQK